MARGLPDDQPVVAMGARDPAGGDAPFEAGEGGGRSGPSPCFVVRGGGGDLTKPSSAPTVDAAAVGEDQQPCGDGAPLVPGGDAHPVPLPPPPTLLSPPPSDEAKTSSNARSTSPPRRRTSSPGPSLEPAPQVRARRRRGVGQRRIEHLPLDVQSAGGGRLRGRDCEYRAVEVGEDAHVLQDGAGRRGEGAVAGLGPVGGLIVSFGSCFLRSVEREKVEERCRGER